MNFSRVFSCFLLYKVNHMRVTAICIYFFICDSRFLYLTEHTKNKNTNAIGLLFFLHNSLVPKCTACAVSNCRMPPPVWTAPATTWSWSCVWALAAPQAY